MSEECISCVLDLNNDIMGIGVRVALYAQIILAWFMSLKWPDTFVKNSRASYMIATSLLVASLIQWKTQTLSVLDALVVSLMTGMMVIFIVVSGTSREEVKPSASRSSQTTPENASTDPTQASMLPNSTPPSDTPPSTPQPALTRHRSSQTLTTRSTSVQPAGSPVTFPQTAHLPPPSVQQQTAEQQAAAQASDPEPSYKPRTSNTQWFIRFCFVNLWGGWCFNLWNDPAHFGLEGPRANCTTNYDVIIWVFGQEVQAVSSGMRIVALVLVSILYFVAICSLFFTLEDILVPVVEVARSISPKSNTTPRVVTPGSLHNDPVVNRIHYLLHLFAFGILLYLLISVEMTIRKNDKEGAMMQWSYGQIIALILLLQQFMDLCSRYVEGREEQESVKEQEERERRKAQTAQVAAGQQDGDISMKDLTPTTPNPTRSTLPI
ncbi:hypothetical protein FRC11_006380 [Ceratobasidium sp. 423]|nr:hypothetical protein FRC11_006380 [Ceratobasidium sp. 423]